MTDSTEEGGGLARRIVSSIFPQRLTAKSDRDRARLTRFTFVLHLRPVRLPRRTLRWTHTFGLGGTALVLASLLAMTGILMMLVYQPVPGEAYASVLTIEQQVSFGALVRGVHWWSANLIVLVVLLHAARVFLTGGFHGPRRFNWVIGVALGLAVLASAFTGYLLPWDQLAYWAVTISTGMLSYLPAVGESLQRVLRGGAEVGPQTLINFYTLHTTIVPVLGLGLMGFHFWRVRRAGGVVAPPPGPGEPQEDERVLFLPHLLMREVAQALVVVALVMVLAVAFGAPLGARANPGMSPNPAKAPWYFVGFQELLIHLHPTFALLVLPLAGLLGLLLMPYVAPEDSQDGRWFLSREGRRAAGLAALAALALTPVLVVIDELRPGTPGWLGGGLAPVAALFVVWSVIFAMARRRLDGRGAEALQTLVVFLSVAFGVLTLIGVWFRGEGMQLSWPWML